jgi:uncharacterized protein GlcG (DUF336 family)
VHELTLTNATIIATKALQEGRRRQLQPLTVGVLDSGGHILALLREERSEFLRIDIATGKAWAALGMGVPGRMLAELSATAPEFFGALAVAARGRFVPGPGGVLIRDEEGEVVGAVGVSGDSGDADEEVAVAGVEAAGFRPDYGQIPEWTR